MEKAVRENNGEVADIISDVLKEVDIELQRQRGDCVS